MRLRKCLIALLLCWPPLARAQFLGYTTAQSVTQKLFTSHTGNGTSPVITNLGQSSHFVTVCNSNFVGSIILESSNDGTFTPANNVVAANYPLADSDCHLIQAGGYYPTMRVRIVSTTGQTSIFYAGIGGPVAPAPAAFSSGGPSSPILCDQSMSANIGPNNTGLTLVIGQPGQTIIVCSMTFSFQGATTAGLVALGGLASTPEPNGGSCTLGVAFGATQFLLATTPATPQTLASTGTAGGLFRLVVGNPLCVTTTTVGVNTIINLAFAQITFGELPAGAVLREPAVLPPAVPKKLKPVRTH